MEFNIRELIANKACLNQLQQSNTMIIVLQFDHIWKQNKQTAFFIIQNYQSFKKELKQFYQKQNESNKIQVQIIIKKFPNFHLDFMETQIIRKVIQSWQGFLIRVKNVVAIETSSVVYYQSKIVYQKICSCSQQQKLVKKQDLIQVLNSFSDNYEQKWPQKCLICKVPLEIDKDKIQLKEYQQIRVLFVDDEQKLYEQTVFLESELVNAISKGDQFDLYCLYNVNLRYKIQDQKMNGNLSPYLVAVQINKIKSFEKKLFKFFGNLIQKMQVQRARNKTYQNLMNILEEICFTFQIKNFKLIFGIFFQLINLFYSKLLPENEIIKERQNTQNKKQNQKWKLENILLFAEEPKETAYILIESFNRTDFKIFVTWSYCDSLEVFLVFLIQNSSKVIIIQNYELLTKQQQDSIIQYLNFGSVIYKRQKIPLGCLFVFLFSSSNCLKIQKQKEVYWELNQVIYQQILDSCLLVLNIEDNTKEFSHSWEMQLIELKNQQKNDFEIKSKQADSQNSNEEEQVSFISGLTNIFSQLRLKKHQKTNSSLQNELDQEIFDEYLKSIQKNDLINNQTIAEQRTIDLLFIVHIFFDIFLSKQKIEKQEIVFNKSDFLIMFMLNEESLFNLGQKQCVLFKQDTKQIKEAIQLYLINKEQQNIGSIYQRLQDLELKVIEKFTNKQDQKLENQQEI